jgi:hypothetical protein
MKRTISILVGLAAAWNSSALWAAAPASSPLERIEGDIRSKGPATGPLESAASPAPATPNAPKASSEGPYLGAFADDTKDRGRGVRVVEVRPGGPSDKADLRPQDLIVGAAGSRVQQMSDLTAVLGQLAAGDKLELDVLRGVQPRKLVVTLGRRPATAAPAGTVPETLPPPPQEPLPGPLGEPPRPEPPAGPSLTLPPAGLAAPAAGDAARLEQLQRRLDQLEQRVEQLERALAEARKKP